VSDTLTLCRTALHDNQHPLHQAAWLLFSPTFNPKAADRLLADQKEAVIQLCWDILNTDELYNEVALGSGNAPIHCVDLLAHWQVKEAVPRFLRILQEEDFETIVYSHALFALKDMGAAILDDILSFAVSADPAIYLDIGSILSEIGRGDPRAYAWIKARFDEQVDEFDIRIWAESLLEVGGEDAIAILEDRIFKQKRKYSRNLRETLQGYIQHMREHGHL
jgi:hypothetical protein